ncbi:MAG: hypothetical protein QOE75_142 [Solirubrobacterales bacterium]|jgi:hypothetical protein|nr:hypothetical protein [Solirubrobacterales bacterium]
MATQNPTGDSADAGASTTALSIYLRTEGAVLVHVLSLHPASLRLPEIVLGMAGASKDKGRRIDCEDAVSALIGAGLLFESGGMIVPTQAALYFHKLTQAGAA